MEHAGRSFKLFSEAAIKPVEREYLSHAYHFISVTGNAPSEEAAEALAYHLQNWTEEAMSPSPDFDAGTLGTRLDDIYENLVILLKYDEDFLGDLVTNLSCARTFAQIGRMVEPARPTTASHPNVRTSDDSPSLWSERMRNVGHVAFDALVIAGQSMSGQLFMPYFAPDHENEHPEPDHPKMIS